MQRGLADLGGSLPQEIEERRRHMEDRIEELSLAKERLRSEENVCVQFRGVRILILENGCSASSLRCSQMVSTSVLLMARKFFLSLRS